MFLEIEETKVYILFRRKTYELATTLKSITWINTKSNIKKVLHGKTRHGHLAIVIYCYDFFSTLL